MQKIDEKFGTHITSKPPKIITVISFKAFEKSPARFKVQQSILFIKLYTLSHIFVTIVGYLALIDSYFQSQTFAIKLLETLIELILRCIVTLQVKAAKINTQAGKDEPVPKKKNQVYNQVYRLHLLQCKFKFENHKLNTKCGGMQFLVKALISINYV